MRIVLALLICIQTTGLLAQTRDDVRLWSSIILTAKISDNWSFKLENETRWEDNVELLGRYFVEPSIRYKAGKHFRFQAKYRFIKDIDDNRWGNKHRATLDAYYTVKNARWSYSIRSRFQYQANGYGFIDDEQSIAEVYHRERLKVSYRLNRIWEPFISIEGWLLIQDPALPGFIGIDRHRLKIGTDYKLSRQIDLGAFLSWQQEWNRNTNDRMLIFGFNASYELF